MPVRSNLVALLQHQVQENPEAAAYIFLAGEELRQTILTYRELDFQARQVAGLLQELKATGECVLLLYPPGLEFIAAFFGCLYAGAIAVPAYPPRLNRNARRVLSIAQDSQARLTLSTSMALSRLDALKAHAPGLGEMRWLATSNLREELAQSWRAPRVETESVAYLQYTSGSTATPKGVMVTHANVFHNSAYLARAFKHSPEDISLSWLPHFHDLGLVHGILQPMFTGFPGYLMAPMSFLQRPLDWLRAISRFRITHSDGPNFAYELCVNKIGDEEKEGLDLSSWRMALNGAEPVFPETIERFAAAFGACGFKRHAFYPAYGLAEATLVVSGGKQGPEIACCSVLSAALEHNKIVFSPAQDPSARTLVASGCIGPGMDVEIVEPDSGNKCAQDKIGEVWVAGPSVARGYWRRAEETEGVFRAKVAQDSNRAFLRTGDLGFIHHGNLFITGRLKELIIIRGRNYYPQDIERAARESCPDVRLGTGTAFSVMVGREEQLVLVQEVNRRQKIHYADIHERMREAVAEEYEIQINEIVLVKEGSIPKTSSGKIQRGLCRKQFLANALDVLHHWRAVREPEKIEIGREALEDAKSIESWLRSRIASRTGLDAAHIPVDRALSHLGLDSLNAVSLAHDIQSGLCLVWQATAFLEDVTITDLAGRAAGELAQKERQKESLPNLAGASEYPLSCGQRGLWFLDRLSPESAAYNVVQAIQITSALDVSALRRSFQALIDRHGCLRTTFGVVEGRPLQRVHSGVEVEFHYENARQWDDGQIRERLSAEARFPFDLEQGPVFRVHLFGRSASEHLLLITAHHIIMDLWSFAQVMKELGELYRAEASRETAALPALTSDYAQFVRWQEQELAGENGEQLWSYWSRQLSGELPVLNLPTDRRRPVVQTYCGASYPFRLSPELAAGLKSVSRDCSVTLYMSLCAAFCVLLHRYTGDEEIIVGTPTAGRTRAEFASVVGYFVNPVPLRVTVQPGSTFRAFLAQGVRRTVLEALERQDYPFSLLAERLQRSRDAGRSPVFQVMFAMQRAHLLHDDGLSLFALGESEAYVNLGGLELKSLPLEQRIAQFDLSLIMAEAGQGLAATIEYNTDLFDSTTIKRMAQHFELLLHSIAADSSQDVSSLSLLTASQSDQLILPERSQQNVSTNACPVHELFELQTERTPDAVAILFGEQEVTYDQLNRRANRLAHLLAGSAVRPGAVVAVCLERSSEFIVALLALFKVGAVYVPLDPEYPRQCLHYLLEDAKVELLVTNAQLPNPELPSSGRVLYLDAARDSLSLQDEENPGIHGDGQMPAYVIHTSGSTGTPKGVLVSHAALSNHMQWLAGEFPLKQGDRVLQKYSSSFDASLSEILYPLVAGATLVIAREGGQRDMSYLIELMRGQQVTVVDVVPSMLKVLLEDGRITTCKDLRRIFSGGEALSVDLKQSVFRQLGQVDLVNMYGPTEAAITSTFHRCDPDQSESRMPIGIPIANVQALVLDRYLQPVPVGVVGEIHVGGEGLAYGYINLPERTAECFVPNPFSRKAGARLYKTGDLGRYREDATIEYVKRADNQAKIRGFRIELGEIEAELRKIENVRNAVAVVKTRPGGEKYITAYMSPADGKAITSAQVRASLQESLPAHMLPAAIVVIEQLPLLPSGKVDTTALPEPEIFPPATGCALPRNHAEEELLKIWQQALSRREISIHDSFFELGGDSILSIQVVSRARQSGLELTPKEIFQYQTIAGLAQIARQTVAAKTEDLSVPGPVPLTPIQKWFFDQDLQAPDHYTQSVLVRAREPLDCELLQEAVEHLVGRHDALRLRFAQTEAGWQQTDTGNGVSGVFCYVSLQHLTAAEQPASIEATALEMRASLNLKTGPMIRAAYVDCGTNPHRLLITVHHLAIDGVSWRILLDDLHQVYEQLKQRRKVSLSRKTLSFKQWAALLQRYARSEEVRGESTWWTTRLSSAVDSLPIDHEGENTAASSSTLCASLTADETRQLLQEVPRAYRTEINDVLLAALAQALTNWSGHSSVLLELEGHGREEVMEGTCPSDIIGWLTAGYPVLLEVERNAPPGAVLKSVKEQLRAIPRKGIGYGLLRYLCADETISKQIESLPEPQISFNYLGQLDQLCMATDCFDLADAFVGPLKDTFGRRSRLLEIDSFVSHGILQFQWTFSTQRHERKTIEELVTCFTSGLRALIQHCVTRKTTENTPSDFRLIQVTEGQLARLQEIHGPMEDIYPLSSMQQGMLFHSLYEPHKGTYLTQFVCELAGDLDKHAFQASWESVIDKHSALKAGFEWEIVSEEPVQVIRRTVELKCEWKDWSIASVAKQETLIAAYLKADHQHEMDLRQPPLMRLALARMGVAKHLMIWTSHHLLMDGWSLPLVLKDVFAVYESLRQKQPVQAAPERPYRNYIAWLRQQDLSRAENFWRRLLKGFAVPATVRSLRRPDTSPANTESACQHEAWLSELETSRLNAFARQNQLTVSSIAQGLWALLLSRIAEKQDVVFGVVVSGRQAPLPGVEEIVGLFINTLPVRVKIAPDDTLRDCWFRIREQQTEGDEFQFAPLSKIQSWSAIPRGIPLFDSIVVFENYPADSWSASSSSLRVTNARSLERSNYPITLWIAPGKQLSLKIGYDANLLDGSRVSHVLNTYRELLAAGAYSRQKVSEILPGGPFWKDETNGRPILAVAAEGRET